MRVNLRSAPVSSSTLATLWIIFVISSLGLSSLAPSSLAPKLAPIGSLSAEPSPPDLWPMSPTLDGLPSSDVAMNSSAMAPPLLAVIGDTRAALNHIGPSARWFAQASWIVYDSPHALLHLGDWVKRGVDYVEWQAVSSSLKLLKGLPLITTRGNHDRGGLYESLGFHADPRYALLLSQIGPLLIITLDSEVKTERARIAVERLRAQARTPKWRKALDKRGIRALIWAQHRPLWSSGNHGSDERGWASWLAPALEELAVTLMLAGHDHDYERFCESRGVGAARHCVLESEARGVTYIVSGGGASVTVPYPNLSWRQNALEREVNDQQRVLFSAAPHYLTLDLDASETLHVRVWATPHEGERALIDHALIPLRPL